MNRNYSFGDLIMILSNLHQLVHLKLNHTSVDRNYLSNRNGDSYKEFSQSLAPSLEILEINFVISNESLEILFNEPKINLQCIRLYNYGYKDSLLRIFIDHAKRKKGFRELGVSHIFHFSKECMKEAQNLFNVIIYSDDEIMNPFYDVPIQNSFWSNRTVN